MKIDGLMPLGEKGLLSDMNMSRKQISANSSVIC